MLDMFLVFLQDATNTGAASGTTDLCSDLGPIVTFIKSVFFLIQFALPIGLIVLGGWDLGKAVFSSDDKEIKAATGKLIKRAIAAVAIFFLVLIVKLIIGFVANSGGTNGEQNANNIINCW